MVLIVVLVGFVVSVFMTGSMSLMCGAMISCRLQLCVVSFAWLSTMTLVVGSMTVIELAYVLLVLSWK